MTSTWRGLSCLASLLCCCAADGQAIKLDWLIVPGVRVGPIKASSSEEDLRNSFGARAVTSKEIDVGEGMTEPGTVVYEGISGKALGVLWKDKLRTRPSVVFVCYGQIRNLKRSGSCSWRTPDGISFGTTLDDLERRNGKPFRLLGFGWDYPGTVVSWEDGRLAKPLTGSGRLLVRLIPIVTRLPSGESSSEAVMGDKEILSSFPLMQKLNPVVYSLQFEFPE
jgi:hypothetical protein